MTGIPHLAAVFGSEYRDTFAASQFSYVVLEDLSVVVCVHVYIMTLG
jgi:hypothetical protein